MYGLTPVIHQEGPMRKGTCLPPPARSPGPLPNLHEWAVAPLTEQECVTFWHPWVGRKSGLRAK